MDVSSYIYSRFSVVFKECYEICHLGRNESSEFITLLQCLNVLEYKSGRIENFSRANNFLLKYENPDMKVFKLL